MKLADRVLLGGASSAVALLLSVSATIAGADEAWPERVVPIDKMTLTAPLKVSVPTPRAIDRSKSSSLILHIFVDEQGVPLHQRIEKSSGNPNLDEAVLHAGRVARFKPYSESGEVVPVTVVAPMHFPFKERRR